jgi:hypothetical protein
LIKKILFLAIIFLSAATIVQAQMCTTKAGFIAAAFESDIRQAVWYDTQADDVSLTIMLRSNRVFILRPGMRVYLENSTVDGLVQIRLQGQTLAVWTVVEAIVCER